jgi:DNA modification methylase
MLKVYVDADYAKTKKHPYRPSRSVRYRRHAHAVVPGVPGWHGRGGMKTNVIHTGDSAEVLKSFDADCIDLTVTSPPYDNLRTYNGFTFDFETIAQQLYRVTKAGGVVVWVVGDATVNGSETGTSFRQALYFMQCDFNLHDTMIWDKVGMRFPDASRYNPVFEYMFIFSKGTPRVMNFIEDKKNVYSGAKVARISQSREADGRLHENSAWINDKNKVVKEYGKRNNIWQIHSGGGEGLSEHPAFFPEDLARDHILSWSNEGGIVLDPFCGSGTTCKMAKMNSRNYIGIEISPEYVTLAEKRILATNVPLFSMVGQQHPQAGQAQELAT